MADVFDFATRKLIARNDNGPKVLSFDQRRDEVGEMMLEIYRNVAAEPMSQELIQFCLDNMPVGNYDDSVMN